MPNRLAQEKSPYLQQHAHNPVDWYPWGEEAFAKAKRENKLVFLSIGYSTCYWCHVMEKECFEIEEVGAALNEKYVSIKVDREEHPEVDEIYMDAIIAMNGQGGWPMSVFLTPDRKPFYGGTYIPREHFLQLLDKIGQAWKETPDQIIKGGDGLTTAISESAPKPGDENIAQAELLGRFCAQADQRFDAEHGGFGGAPKFPSAQAIRLLMRIYQHQRHPKLLEMALRSLDRMAAGGIYDQLGGGFHRYAVDDKWLVPHFEKMLYDNALLVPAYLEAHWLTDRPRYAHVARETLDYMLRDLRAPGGAFFSAEDAGEVKKEGEFYVWQEAEVRAALGASFEKFASVYPVTKEGNFEHANNVLHISDFSKWEESQSLELRDLREKLLRVREKRPRPHRDSKILTAWNGLALSAFALGFRVLGDEKYLRAAEECARWLREHLFRGGVLLRRYCDGDSRYNGTAADYTFLIQGLLSLYEASFEPTWLLWARELQAHLDDEFWNEKGGGYFTASRKEEGLITRKIDRNDGALPSPNSVAYGNLLRLSQYFVDPALDDRAAELFLAHGEHPEKNPLGLPTLLLGLYLRQHGGPRLCVLTGAAIPKRRELLAKLQKRFLPDLMLAGMEGNPPAGIPVLEGKGAASPTIFLCEDGTCHPPRAAEDAIGSIK
jgi:uncharacterized protein YyaL (SSP411 family)